MNGAAKSLSEFDRHNLYKACAREAERLGGGELCAAYFFERAQSSRVWLSRQSEVTVADMEIADWCAAIAWSAPGVGRPPKRAEEPSTDAVQRKQPRVGAHFRRSSGSTP